MVPNLTQVRPSRRQALKAIGTVATAVGVTSTTSAASTDISASTEEVTVTLEDQTPHHGTVYISEATLPEDGFIALHDASFLIGGPVIGVSAPLEAGSYANLPVEFDEYPDRSLAVAAIAHRDTPSDGVFTFPDDGDSWWVVDNSLVHDTAHLTME